MSGDDQHDGLTGQHVRLIPYTRGGVPRGTLPVLWALMDHFGDHERLFATSGDGGTPYSWRGDPTEFMAYFGDPKRLVFIVQNLKDEAPVGLWWYDDIVPGFRAAGNIWILRRAWGQPAREASRLAVEYGFNVLGFEAIWAYTPWPHARRHAEATGFIPVATLPGFVRTSAGVRDVYMLRRLRDG